MKGKIGKIGKNVRLYFVLSLFVLGGLYLSSSKTAFAATVWGTTCTATSTAVADQSTCAGVFSQMGGGGGGSYALVGPDLSPLVVIGSSTSMYGATIDGFQVQAKTNGTPDPSENVKAVIFNCGSANGTYVFGTEGGLGISPTLSFINLNHTITFPNPIPTNCQIDFTDDDNGNVVFTVLGNQMTSTYISIYFQAYSGTPPIPPAGTSTRFVSINSPANFSTGLSNTITFSGSYFMSSADGSSSVPYSGSAFVAITGQATNVSTSSFSILLPITTFDSVVSFSTTTTLLNDSRYTWNASFICPQNINAQDQCQAAGVQTAAATLSGGYNFFQFTTGSFQVVVQPFDLSSCNVISGFDAITCVQNLVVPSPSYLGIALGQIQATMYTIPPWGYIVRVINIMDGSATTTIPAFSYTFGNDLPIFAGDTLTIDTASYINSASTLLNTTYVSDTNGETAWQIFGPLVDDFLYIVLAMAIIADITGIRLIHHKK